MFNKKAVSIVGAGPSHELGLPLGSSLAAEVKNMMQIGMDSIGRLTGIGDRAFANYVPKYLDASLGEVVNANDTPAFLPYSSTA